MMSVFPAKLDDELVNSIRGFVASLQVDATMKEGLNEYLPLVITQKNSRDELVGDLKELLDADAPTFAEWLEKELDRRQRVASTPLAPITVTNNTVNFVSQPNFAKINARVPPETKVDEAEKKIHRRERFGGYGRLMGARMDEKAATKGAAEPRVQPVISTRNKRKRNDVENSDQTSEPSTKKTRHSPTSAGPTQASHNTSRAPTAPSMPTSFVQRTDDSFKITITQNHVPAEKEAAIKTSTPKSQSPERQGQIKRKNEPKKSDTAQKCAFFPNCTNKECSFFHPTEPCKLFPACPFGEKCLFVHPALLCKFGAKCTRPNCSFSHPKKGDVPCKFGSACTRADCPFLHQPKQPGSAKAVKASVQRYNNRGPATQTVQHHDMMLLH